MCLYFLIQQISIGGKPVSIQMAASGQRFALMPTGTGGKVYLITNDNVN